MRNGAACSATRSWPRPSSIAPRFAYEATFRRGTPAALIESLTEAKAAGNLPRARSGVLTHPDLLVVYEIGYLPISQDGAVSFFQLTNARHERARTALRSNKALVGVGRRAPRRVQGGLLARLLGATVNLPFVATENCTVRGLR